MRGISGVRLSSGAQAYISDARLRQMPFSFECNNMMSFRLNRERVRT